MNVLARWNDNRNGTDIRYEIVQRDDNENDLYEISDSVRYISTKSDGMRVNVKFNDFTVRKLKPNIFENYQLIEAAAQQQQQSSVKENDEHVTEGSHETGSHSPSQEVIHHQHHDDEKMDDSDDDDENRLCEWAGCSQTAHQGLQGLVQHVNSSHVQPCQVGGGFVCLWRDCPRKEREFNARYKMLIHMRIHTREKPHECKECGKRFSRHENLKIHVRTHTGEKPFQCSYCEKKFNNSSDRFKHQRTHINNRPYRCKINGCEKGYTDPSSLRKHVRSVHGFNDPAAYKDYIEMQDSNQPEMFDMTGDDGAE